MAKQQLIVRRPGSHVSVFVRKNARFIARIPKYILGTCQLPTEGAGSPKSMLAVGLLLLLVKVGVLYLSERYNRQHFSRFEQPDYPHTWSYSPEQVKLLSEIYDTPLKLTENLLVTHICYFLEFAAVAAIVLLALITTFSNRILKFYHVAQIITGVLAFHLCVTAFHLLALFLPSTQMEELLSSKLQELVNADLAQVNAINLQKQQQPGRSLAMTSLLQRLQQSESCCGLVEASDWLQPQAQQMHALLTGDFVTQRSSLQPLHVQAPPPAACSGQLSLTSACASVLALRYWQMHPILPALIASLVLSALASLLIRRWVTAGVFAEIVPYRRQEEIDEHEEQMEVSQTVSSWVFSAQSTNNDLLFTGFPLTAIGPAMAKRRLIENPLAGGLLSSVPYARLPVNEPLSTTQEAMVSSCPQLLPLLSAVPSASVNFLRVVLRAGWGLLVAQMFGTRFAGLFSTEALLIGGNVGHLLVVAVYLAFILPTLMSDRFLLLTIIFVPSICLDLGAAFLLAEIINALISGPVATFMQNANQTMLTFHCLVLSTSELAEAATLLSMKPFINCVNEFTASVTILSFLLKKINESVYKVTDEFDKKLTDVNKRPGMDDEDMDKYVLGKDALNVDMDSKKYKKSQKEMEDEATIEKLIKKEEDLEEEDRKKSLAASMQVVNATEAALNKVRSLYNRLITQNEKLRQYCLAKVKNYKKRCGQTGGAVGQRLWNELPFYIQMLGVITPLKPNTLANRWNRAVCSRFNVVRFITEKCLKVVRGKASDDVAIRDSMTDLDELNGYTKVEMEFQTWEIPPKPRLPFEQLLIDLATATASLMQLGSIFRVTELLSVVSGLLVAAVIAEMLIFVKRYNNDPTFQNFYLTDEIMMIDVRRSQTIVNKYTKETRETLLPFSQWELKEPVWVGMGNEKDTLTDIYTWRMSHGEWGRAKARLRADVIVFAIVMVAFAIDFVLRSLLEIFNEAVPGNLTFSGQSQLNITYYGFDKALMKKLTFGLVKDLAFTANITKDVRIEECKLTPAYVHRRIMYQLAGLGLIKMLYSVLSAYPARYRPSICAFFNEYQHKRRAVVLYNQLLWRRAKHSKDFKTNVIKRILAEKFDVRPLTGLTKLRLKYPRFNSIIQALPLKLGLVSCLCCGERGLMGFKVCFDCNASYCHACWRKLQAQCLLCILLYKKAVKS